MKMEMKNLQTHTCTQTLYRQAHRTISTAEDHARNRGFSSQEITSHPRSQVYPYKNCINFEFGGKCKRAQDGQFSLTGLEVEMEV